MDGPRADLDEPIDPLRMVFLGGCTMALGVLFVLMLLADNANALTF